MSEDEQSDELEKEFQKGMKLLKKAQDHISKSNWIKTLDVLEVAHKIFEKTKTVLMEAQVYWLTGIVYENQAKWDAAEMAFRQCLELRENLAPQIVRAKTHNKLAKISLYLKKFEQAHDHAQISLDLFEGQNQPLLRADALYLKGSIYFIEKEAESAEFYFKLALEDLKLQHNWSLFLQIQENLATTYKWLGKYLESNVAYVQALKLRQKANNYATVSAILANVADNHKELGNKTGALKFITDSIEIRKKLTIPGKKEVLARSYLKYAEILMRFGDLVKAEDICEDCITTAEENDLNNILLDALVLMAQIQTGLLPAEDESYDLIKNYCKEAEELALKLNNFAAIVRIKIHYIQIYKKFHENEKITDSLEETLDYCDKHELIGVHPQLYGEIYEELGIYMHSMKKYELSLKNFEKAVTFFKKGNRFAELAEAHYNAACSACLQHLGEETLKHLNTAVNLNIKYKKLALADEDFRAIENDEPFLNIVKPD
jgi:tetratricopeptide (TPR) repeat protein